MTQLAAMQEQAENVTDRNVSKTQFLTFILGGQEYAINIMNVMEIRRWEEPTPVPKAPDFVKGIINLRGQIIPVIDLRDKFQLEQALYNALTAVIIVQVEHDEKTKTMGLVIDSVSDVLNLADDELQITTKFVNDKLKEHIKGMYNYNKKIITILDAETISSLSEEAKAV